MIDFIKCEVLGVGINDLQHEKNLDFSGKYHLSGEVETKRVYAKYKEMLITIHDDRRVFLQGSIPIMVFGNNYMNLQFEEFEKAVHELETLFGVDAKNFILQNFEFGFSLDLKNKNPTNFLIDELIDFKGEIGSVDTYAKNGYGVQFHKEQFHLKLYDKASQYNLDNNLLRIEVRVKRMDYVKKIRVYTLNDLMNSTKWYELKNKLVSVISELVICSMDDLDWNTTPIPDLRDISLWKNPQFWRSNRPNSKVYAMGSKDGYYLKRRKIYYDFKQKFAELIKKYKLDSTKLHILEQINKEYRYVLPKPPTIEKYDMGILPWKMKYSPLDLMRRG